MRLPARIALLAALLLVSVNCLRAEAAVDASGHWTGTIQVPGMELGIELDLATAGNGALEGTVSIPSQNIKGLPLLNVGVEGTSVAFHARTDQVFKGTLSADGKSISGNFNAFGYSVPFGLTRTGDARIEPLAKSPPIGKELEGTWNGTATVNGMPLRLVLTLTNQPDGTAAGNVVNLDQGGLTIPMRITQKASDLTLDSAVITGSYSGALNAAGTELVGTWTEGALTLPLTFRRAAAAEGKE